MVNSDIGKLEHFLKSRFGFKVPNGLEFKRMTQEKLDKWLDNNETIKGKVVNLSMNDFLTEDLFFNKYIEDVVSETIKQKGLRIYIGIVSYDGRDETALTTGGNTFNNLKNLEQQGFITRFLSYQGNRNNPSPLCRFASNEGIKVYFVDDVSVVDKKKQGITQQKCKG